MKAPAFALLILATAISSGVAFGQTYQLRATAFGSAGSIQSGSTYWLGMTAGQSVTGTGSGPTVPIYAEVAGFWHWSQGWPVDVEEPGDDGSPVAHFALFSNTPNPFRRKTTIRYAIPTSAGATEVSVRLFDLAGRLVRVLESGTREPGVHTATWDGTDEVGYPVGGGIYFYRIDAGRFSATRRLARIP